MSAVDTPLRRVVLTWQPHEGEARERSFDYVTPTDLVFVVAAFHARKRRSLSGRSEVTRLLDEARRDQMLWHENRVREALAEGLGWWARLVTKRARERVVEALLDEYFDSTAQWAVELGDLHQQVDALQDKVATLRAKSRDKAPPQRRGPVPMLLCGGDPACTRGLPLFADAPLEEGWTFDGAVPYCPDHPVASKVAG